MTAKDYPSSGIIKVINMIIYILLAIYMQENVKENKNPKESYKINKSGSNTCSNAFSNPDRYGSEKVKEIIKEIQDKGGYVSDIAISDIA
jgi:hypothetical protein